MKNLFKMAISIESLVFQYLKAHSTAKVVKKFCQEVNLDASTEESKAENLPKLSELLKQFQNEKNSNSNSSKKRKIQTEQENVSQGLKKPKLDLSSTECFKCHKVGHMSRECPEKGNQRILGTSGASTAGYGDSDSACFNCNKPGHFSRECPEAKLAGNSSSSASHCYNCK